MIETIDLSVLIGQFLLIGLGLFGGVQVVSWFIAHVFGFINKM